MLSVKGDLELMTLPDILQWAEMNNKDGTLAIKRDGVQKLFFFQQGKLIYFSSQKKEEKLVDHLIAAGLLSHEKLVQMLSESKKLKIPIICYLISEKTIAKEALYRVLNDLISTAIIEALQWPSGSFEFNDEIPPLIIPSPIKLDVANILYHSSAAHDESDESGQRHVEQVLQDLERRIQSGRIDLPATPDLIGKLDSATKDDGVSLAKITEIITSDQPLASKILKVANSPFFNRGSGITSLQRAITIMGLSSVKSIATAHALITISPGNEKKIKPVLSHSLLAAFIAKELGQKIDEDTDEFFVCAILHDIGKTIMIDYLSAGELPSHLYGEILDTHHSRVGYLLAREWELSEIVQETVLNHHTPDQATRYPHHILITYLANRIANGTISEEDLQRLTEDVPVEVETIRRLIENIDTIKDKVAFIL